MENTDVPEVLNAMALNKRRITQRPIGPAMQWTTRASQKPDAQKTAGNINIDLEAYQTAERKQPEPKRHKPSKQTGNPVAYKKQKGTKERSEERRVGKECRERMARDR